MEETLPDYLTKAAETAQGAQAKASQFGAYAGAIPDLLKKSIQKAYQDNMDIIQPLDTATAQYLQAPSEARVKYQDIFNPFQRENLVSQYTSNQAIPMMSYSGVYGQRMGRAGDLLTAGVGAYQSDLAAKQAAADAAQQAYQNTLQQYQLTEDKRRWEIGQASSTSNFDIKNLIPDISDEGKYISNNGFQSGMSSGSVGGNTSDSKSTVRSLLEYFLPNIFKPSTGTGGSW